MSTAQQTTKQQILDELDSLRADQLEQVLSFILQIQGRPRGIPGKELAEFLHSLPDISEEEAQQMDAILKEMREMSMPRG